MTTRNAGILFTTAAYLLWGVFPVYFLLLAPTGPWEVVAWRVLLSLVFCVLLLAVTRGWRRLAVILRSPRLLGAIALAGVLIYANWQIFVIGTLSGHVVETSLGYFINPIATMLLGVFVMHERLRPLQWIAVGIAVLAVVVLVIGYGSVPWIALGLTATFGLYGLVKKRIGPSVDAVSGLTLETAALVPVAVVQLVAVGVTTGITAGTVSWWHTALIAFAGVATALPLLLFAAGTRRIDLTVVGMLQFITPVMQFILGVAILGEPMPTERWIGFAIVWLAIVVFLIDLMRHAGGRHPASLP